MIQTQPIVNVADNSGARRVMCIKVLGDSRKRYARIGDLIACSVKAASPGGTVKRGEGVKAVIVRTKKEIRRSEGRYSPCGENAEVIRIKENEPVGTRIFGPVERELREKNFMRIVSLAPEVL